MYQLNELRRLAGLPILEKHGHYEPLEAPPENDPKGEHTDAAPKDKKEGEEEPTFPEVVTAIAAKAEGKKGDELVDLINKVYNAGVADGIASMEEKKEDKGDKKKDKKDEKDEEPKGDDEAPEDLPPEELPPEEEDKKVKEALEVARLRRLVNY